MKFKKIINIIILVALMCNFVEFSKLNYNNFGKLVSFGDSFGVSSNFTRTSNSDSNFVNDGSYGINKNKISMTIKNFNDEINDANENFKFSLRVRNNNVNDADRFNLETVFEENSCLSLVNKPLLIENIELPTVKDINILIKVDKVNEDKEEVITFVLTKNVLNQSNGKVERQKISTYQKEVFIKHVPQKAVIIVPGIVGSEIFAARSQQFNGVQYSENHRIWPPEEIHKLIRRNAPDASDFFDGQTDGSDSIVKTESASQSFVDDEDGTEIERHNAPKILGIDVERVINDFKNLVCDDEGRSRLLTKPSYPFDCRKEGNERFYGSVDVYKDLAESLVKNEKLSDYNIIFFSYDWRLSNVDIANELERFVNENKYEDVVLVAHSMGGLACTCYLSNEENKAKVDKFISIGTPFLGANKAINVVESGQFFDGFIGSIIAPVANGFIKEIIKNCPSAYELFPPEQMVSMRDHNVLEELTYSYLCGCLGCCFNSGPQVEKVVHAYDKYTEIFTNRWHEDIPNISRFLSNAQLFHNKLYKHNRSILLGNVDLYNIVGYNINTIGTSQIIYDIDDIGEGQNGELTYTMMDDGDGTVTFVSATMNNTLPHDKSYKVKGIDHLGLVSDESVIKLISNIILNCPGVFDDSKINQMFGD